MLFPGGLLPLHVFEERYRLLVRERRDFGVVLIRHGREVGPGQGDDVHPVGTVARLREVRELPDGRFHVVAQGLHRFRIEVLERDQPYLTARIRRLADEQVEARPTLLRLLDRYLALRGLRLPPGLVSELGERPGSRLVWLAGTVLQSEPDKRQRLLEAGDPTLAESMLVSEVAKLQSLGRLGNLPPRRQDRN